MSLITIKGWELRKCNDKDLKTVNMTGHHLNCPNSSTVDISWFSVELPICWNCKAPVPDEIQALMFMYDE